MRFQSLAEVTPHPQELQIYRMLIALIGDDHLTDFNLSTIDWICVDSYFMHGNNSSASPFPCVKAYLMDHHEIEKKLKSLIQNPEEVISKVKFLKVKAHVDKNETVFQWLIDNKNKFVYNTIVYYLAQIIKLTVKFLHHLLTTQGDLFKSAKLSKAAKNKIRVRKIRIDSYKKLLRKPWLKSMKSRRSVTQGKKHRGISNLNQARALYREDSCTKKKTAPPRFGKLPAKSPFELDSEDEQDLELSRQ